MSYILDALRRAEAERERGAVPSLQSQQHTQIEDDDVSSRRRPLVWAVVALSAALVATLAWNLLGGRAAPESRPVAEGSVAPAPTAPAPAVAPAAAVPQSTAAPQSVPAPPAAVQATPPLAASTAARAVARPPTAIEARRARREPAGAASAASAPGRPETRIFALGELPEDVRRELPRLTINGASYSGDAASRMVMINGQVFHEGDRLAAGLVLEKIKLKSAVLAYKGWRYEVTF